MAATESNSEEAKSAAFSEPSPSPASLQACFEHRKQKSKAESSLETAETSPTGETLSLSAYSAWKQSQNIPPSTKVYTVVCGQYPDIHQALQRRGEELLRLCGKSP